MNQQSDARRQGEAVANVVEIGPSARKRFEELAVQWEHDTVLLSSSSRAARYPAYQEVLQMGWPAVPLILQRMQRGSGHWLLALHDITGVESGGSIGLRQDRRDAGILAGVGQTQWLCPAGRA